MRSAPDPVPPRTWIPLIRGAGLKLTAWSWPPSRLCLEVPRLIDLSTGNGGAPAQRLRPYVRPTRQRVTCTETCRSLASGQGRKVDGFLLVANERRPGGPGLPRDGARRPGPVRGAEGQPRTDPEHGTARPVPDITGSEFPADSRGHDRPPAQTTRQRLPQKAPDRLRSTRPTSLRGFRDPPGRSDIA
jgi:hypothetical protein